MFLDKCFENEDVQSAMRLANMANTFHKYSTEDYVNKLHHVSSKYNISGKNDQHIILCISSPILCHHRIWYADGFFETALIEGVSSQIRIWATEPVLWDELSPEALREAVVGEYYTMNYTVLPHV